MTDRKRKEKKFKKPVRTQSCLEKADVGPTLPPRPPGGLRNSSSFDNPFSPSSVPDTPGHLMEDTPPPIPTTPRPKLGSSKPPAPLPPMEEARPPLPTPLSSFARSRSNPARRQSTPATPPSPASPDPRYVKSSAVVKTGPGATPEIVPDKSAQPPSEEQLRSMIEMQSQNTEELRKLLEGKDGESLTPSELVGKFGKYFPFRATIVKGFYNNRAEIVAGEIYSIHFLKNARVIGITDSSGEKYVLPLNAAMRIGFEQQNQPAVYYSVNDIINSTEPPKLISPREDYRSNECKIKQDEVLQVKGVHVSRMLRHKSLVVVNVKTSEEKKLPSDCSVSFSTDSSYTQLSLSDVVNKMPGLIPGNARLYPTVDVVDLGFPSHLVSELVRVKRHYQERSLITTLEEQEPRPVDRFSLSTEPVMPVKVIYDIPLSLDIEFTILPPEPEEDIYDYTHRLCQQFDPRKLQSGDGLGLNMALDEENIYSGVELELPPYINFDPAAPPPSFIPGQGAAVPAGPPPLPARNPSQQDSDGEEYTEVDFVRNLTTRDIPSSLPPPLPSSLPPTTRPAAAGKPSAQPRASPRIVKKKEIEATPPPTGPRPRSAPKTSASAAGSSLDNGEYVDVTEDKSHTAEPPHLPSHPPSSISPPPPSHSPVPGSPVLSPCGRSMKPQIITPSNAPTASSLAAAAAGVGRSMRDVSPASSDTYDDIGEALRPRLPSPPPPSDDVCSEDEQEILKQFSELQSVVQSARVVAKRKQSLSSPSHTTTELKRLRDDLKRVSAFPQKIINHCMVLEREVSTLRDVVKEVIVKTSSSEALEENREFLKSFSVAQVVKMLGMLNMEKYQDRFASEGVDGSLLADFEDSVLETSLGVTSKLDRIKLMKIIKGERSPKSVLEGQYNYVALQPR